MNALPVVAGRLWLDPAFPDRSCRGADPDLFMQADGERQARVSWRMTPVAEFYCRGCPVRVLCREAGRSERWGLWGGVVRFEGGGGRLAELDLLR